MNNFLLRTLTGALYVALVIGSLTLGVLPFVAVFGLFCALALWEFATLMNDRLGVQINKFISTMAGVYLFLAFFGYASNLTAAVVFVPYLLSLIYLLVSELYLNRANPLANWAYAFAAHIYVALPFALLPLIAIRADAAAPAGVSYDYIYPLAIFLFLWINDTGAYLFGSTLGRFVPYKLFPRISPKKSWIGSVGGGLAVLGASIGVAAYFSQLTLWQWIGLGLVVVVFGTWGDLVESMIKRQLGVKDSGTMMPGHGGMLDRFDSFLLASPAALIYLYCITL